MIPVKLRILDDCDDHITLFLGPIHIQQHESAQDASLHLAGPPLPFVFQLCCLSKEEVIPGVTDLVSMLIIMILITGDSCHGMSYAVPVIIIMDLIGNDARI